MTDPKTEARLPRDLVTILRTEAKNQRTPPIDYVIAWDGCRAIHQPDPDFAMAELLEEAATALAAKDAELAAEHAALRLAADRADRAEAQLAEARKALEALELSGNTGELIDKMAEAIRGDTTSDDTPWATLSEDRKIGWRGDAERALAVVKEYLTARRPEGADHG